MATVCPETAKNAHTISIVHLISALTILLLNPMVIVRQLHLVKPAVVLPSAHTQMVLRVMGFHAHPANVLQH